MKAVTVLAALLLCVAVARVTALNVDSSCIGTTASTWSVIASHSYDGNPITFCLDGDGTFVGSNIVIPGALSYDVTLWGPNTGSPAVIDCTSGCGFSLTAATITVSTTWTFKQLTFDKSNGTLFFEDGNSQNDGTLILETVVYSNVQNLFLPSNPDSFGSLFRLEKHVNSVTISDCHFSSLSGSLVTSGSVGGSVLTSAGRIASDFNLIVTASTFADMCESNVESVIELPSSASSTPLVVTISDSSFTDNINCGNGVLNFKSATGSVTLDITASNFTGNTGASAEYGGVVTLMTTTQANTVTIINSIFDSNAGGKGGALAFESSVFSILDIEGVSCTNNAVSSNNNGGCLSIKGPYSITVDNTDMLGNSAGGSGGALYFEPSGSSAMLFNMTNVNVSNNAADQEGGGVYVKTSDSLTFHVISSTISGNSAGNAGGGLVCDTNVECYVTDSTMERNVGASGGAISAYSSTITVTGTTVSFNEAATVGGGLNCFSATCTVTTSTFDSNTASSGGAMYALFTGADLRISNSYIARNTEGALVSFLALLLEVTDSILVENFGAAVDSLQSEVSLSGLIVRENQATSGAIQISGAGDTVFINDSFVASNLGYGLLCGDATVELFDTTVCGSATANVQCNFGCNVERTMGASVVADWCAEANAEVSERPCEQACVEDEECVQPLFPFSGPFDGCFLCGSPCLSEATNNCSVNAYCLDNAASTFDCQCFTGYNGTGVVCEDIDECSSSALNDCGASSECINNNGSYTCSCPPGQTTDQNNACVDIDECLLPNNCSVDAACINVIIVGEPYQPPFYECACLPGFYGDGIECTACPANRTTLIDADSIEDCFCVANTYPNVLTPTDPSLPCEACPPGTKVGGQVCNLCTGNTYSTTYNAATCMPCPASYLAPAGSTSAADCACQAGFIPDPAYTGSGVAPCVIECFAGYYREDETCLPCGRGYYNSEANVVGLQDESPCTKCPQYTTTTVVINGVTVDVNNATSVEQCVCVPPVVVSTAPASQIWGTFSYAPIDPNNATLGCIVQCPPGSFRPSPSARECEPCQADTYTNVANQTACLSCPSASSTNGAVAATSPRNCTCDEGFSDEEQEGVCDRQCGPGFFYVSQAQPCVGCGDNFYSEGDNAPACTECPENNVAPPKSTSITACQCAPGYYTLQGETGTPCVICPEGGTCLGGVSIPIAEPGYTPVEDENGAVTFQECVPRSACVGDGKCAVGYVGEICNECDPAYDQCANEPDMPNCDVVKYYRLNGICKQCKGSPGLVVAAVYFGLVALQVILVWLNLQERVLNRFASLVIGVNSLQIAAQYGRLDIDWPPIAKEFFDILSIANFNLELVAPECAVPVGDPFVLRWLATMFFPLIIAANFAVIYLVAHGIIIALTRANSPLVERMPTARIFRHTAIRSLYQLMMIAYLPLSAAAFELFDCPKDSNGVRVINVSRGTQCFKGTYWVLFPFGLIFVVLYPVGMPLFYYRLLKTKLASLGPIKFYIRYGFLVGRFSENFYLFELLIMARKLGVVLAMSFLTSSPYIKAGGAIVVLQFSLWLHLETLPYRTTLYNWMETICLFCSILVLLLSMLFQDESFKSAAKDGTVLTVLFVMICCIVGGIVIDSYILWKDRRSGGADEDVSFRAAGFVDNSGAAADDKTFDEIALQDLSSVAPSVAAPQPSRIQETQVGETDSVHSLSSFSAAPNNHASGLESLPAPPAVIKEAPDMPDGAFTHATASAVYTGTSE